MAVGIMSEVRMYASDRIPRFWSACNGSLLSISQNQALFSLLGNTFGGDGRTTFGLPDLRGRVPVGPGSIGSIVQGQTIGNETTVITGNMLPPHIHDVSGSIQMMTTIQPANSKTPADNYFANDAATTRFDPSHDAVTMASPIVNLAVGPAGNGQPISNLMPYLVVNYIICLSGIFPSRN